MALVFWARLCYDKHTIKQIGAERMRHISC